ncbi:MAG: hypothetical protein QGG36_17315 [Pirellulaceae bacterium]|nr:hypothetical protein [Pirellulaceae bacterium]
MIAIALKDVGVFWHEVGHELVAAKTGQVGRQQEAGFEPFELAASLGEVATGTAFAK